MYRFGDGTQFPLEENFIETLTAAVEACAGAYTPIADLDDRRERAREGKRQSDKEQVRLLELEVAMETAGDKFGPSTGRTATPVQQVAAKAIAGLKQAVASAKAQIQTRVQQLEGEASGAGLGGQIRSHLAPLFEKHTLPGTAWATAWDARGAVAVGTAVSTAGKIAATFDLTLAGTWAQGVRIDLLAPGLTLLLPKRKAFGGAKPQVVHLDKHALVAYERNGGHTTLIVRENPTKPSPGYRFSEENGAWLAVAIDHNNEVQGEELAQTPNDSVGLVTLADAAAAAIEGYRKQRTLKDLRLANQPLDTHPQPRLVVDAILTALTPLARSLKEKSKIVGELVLKRDLGGGKREEIFVPRTELAAMFTPLPPEYRKGFEDMGLSREQTQPGTSGGRDTGSERAIAERAAADRAAIGDDIPTVVVEATGPREPARDKPAGTLPPLPPGAKTASGNS